MGANSLIQLGESERGVEWARKALEQAPKDAAVLYNVACIHELAGQAKEALDYLEDAVEVGFAHREWIENDNDLKPIRDHPRYLVLLDRLA